MLIDFPGRTVCHAIEFGFLREARSGATLRQFGRHATRMTMNYPTGCMPVALPSRLASHVNALPHVIDPTQHDSGALLILPAYAREGRGLRPACVTLQRIRLFPDEDREGMPGDCVRSAALTFDWQDYGRHAPTLGPVAARLRPEPVTIEEERGRRFDQSRVAIALGRRPEAAAAATPAARAILGAVARGMRLRLDERWCRDETGFLEAFCAALARLPEHLRGHVSAATGLIDADGGFQICWAANGWGLDPASPRAQAVMAAGEDAGAAGETADPSRPCPIDDGGAFAGLAGLVAPVFEEPGVHAHVRSAVRDWLSIGGAHDRQKLSSAEARAHIAAFLHGGDVSPSQADALIEWASRERPVFAASREDPATAAALSVLCAIAPAMIDLAGIAAAVEICDMAEDCVDHVHARKVRRLAGELLGAHLAQYPCPSQAMLDKILRCDGLAATAARRILGGDARVTAPLRRSLIVMARGLGVEAAPVLRAAGRLLPRDPRIAADWRDYVLDDASLAQGLIAAARDEGRLEPTAAAALADGLIEGGKWNLVRDILQQLTARLGRAAGDAPEDAAGNSRCLELVATLARSLQKACAPRPTLQESRG